MLAALPLFVSVSAISADRPLTTLHDVTVIATDAARPVILAAQPEHKRYIVELKTLPVATYRDEKLGTVLSRDNSGRIALGSHTVSQHQQELKQEQDAAVSAMQQLFPEMTVDKRFDMVFNGVVIEGTALDSEQLTALSYVKQVYEDRLVYVNTQSSLSTIDAPAAWSLLRGQDTAGSGIKIAVIDSGIRPENPMFDDDGIRAPTVSELPTDDYCRTVQPSFCNNKVIVARSYPAPEERVAAEHMTPLAYHSHGPHIAGTVAGRRITATLNNGSTTELSGVAPGAHLMVYKALYANAEGKAVGYTSSLLAAINDAVRDGAHIINNSWGGIAGEDPDFSPYKAVYQAVEDAGVLMVSAAGNNGASGSGTIGCPGCIEAGITVANTDKTDKVHPTSSRGPNGDSRFIKPDLSAPGTAILSAASPDENNSKASVVFKSMTGTSMAAPHVAGAAALLKAAHPTWTPAQLKAALTTTSYPDVLDSDGQPANVFAAGAGRLDIGKAINAGLTVAPVSIAGHYCLNSCQFSIDAGHLATGSLNWTGQLRFADNSGVTGELSVNGIKTDIMSFSDTAKRRSFSVDIDTVYAEKDQWHFGEILWRDNSGRYPDARIPVAVYAGNSSNKNQLISAGAAVAPGASAVLSTQWENVISADGLQIYIPDGVSVEGQPVINITDQMQSRSESARFNPDTGVIRWTGALNSWFTPVSGWSLPSLTQNTSLAPVGCTGSGACDEGSFSLQVADKKVTYLGMPVSSMTFHSNGYLTFNDKTIDGQSFLNDNLPTGRATGAVLAPFWTDLDISASGEWYAVSRTISGRQYYVLEWNNARLAEDNSNNRYTFQVILAQGGNGDTYINYIDIGSIPSRLTVGVQDFSGKGSALYNNGTGIAPVSGTAYRVEKSAGGQAELSYQLSSRQLKTMQLNQGAAASVNLADRSSVKYIIKSELLAGSQTTTAYSLFEVIPENIGTLQGVNITRLPDNGAIVVEDNGIATYTPFSGFSGKDRFSYTLMDINGRTTSEAEVAITVMATIQTPKPPPPLTPVTNAPIPSATPDTNSGSSGGSLGYAVLLFLILFYRQRMHS